MIVVAFDEGSGAGMLSFKCIAWVTTQKADGVCFDMQDCCKTCSYNSCNLSQACKCMHAYAMVVRPEVMHIADVGTGPCVKLFADFERAQ